MRAGYKSEGTSSGCTTVPIFFLFCGHRQRQRQRRLLVAGARRPLCSPHPHRNHPSVRPPIIPLVAVGGVVTEPEPTARFNPNHRAVSLHRAGLESCLSLGFLMLW